MLFTSSCVKARGSCCSPAAVVRLPVLQFHSWFIPFPALSVAVYVYFKRQMPFWLVFWAKISSKKLCVLLRFPSAYIRQALKHITLLHIQPFEKLRVCKSALTGAGVAEGTGGGPSPTPCQTAGKLITSRRSERGKI